MTNSVTVEFPRSSTISASATCVAPVRIAKSSCPTRRRSPARVPPGCRQLPGNCSVCAFTVCISGAWTMRMTFTTVGARWARDFVGSRLGRKVDIKPSQESEAAGKSVSEYVRDVMAEVAAPSSRMDQGSVKSGSQSSWVRAIRRSRGSRAAGIAPTSTRCPESPTRLGFAWSSASSPPCSSSRARSRRLLALATPASGTDARFGGG